MVFEFKLPDIGEGVHEGEIVQWLVKEGESVEENQDICEVMTDKATVQISSPRTGTIQKIFFTAGQVVNVGDTFVTIQESDEPAATPTDAPTPSPAASDDEEPPELDIPKEEKTLFDLPTEIAAGPRAARRKTGDARPAVKTSGPVLAMPKTRRLAKESGIDLGTVAGTGAQGQITDADVKAFKGGAPAATASGPAHSFAFPTIPTEGVAERKGLSPLRKRIAENLVRSKHLAPHYTYVVEIDAEKLIALKDEAKGIAAEAGTKLTFLPFLAKAVVHAMRKHPMVNANIDEAAKEVVLFNDVNIGVAVATPHGLLVPVVKQCQAKSVLQISRDIEEVADRARAMKAKPEDFKGGTFTITSLGKLGGLHATPILNHPEVAIMGVHSIRDVPVIKDGQIVPGKRMNLSFSFDHRIIDGYDGARFVEDLVRYLEDPNLLLLESF